MDFFNVHISPEAPAAVARGLASGRISEGALVRQFEGELTARLGLLHPVAVNSGTAALHLGLAVAGVGPGDEVILPPQTFVATGLAILMQGAVPVFADIDPDTGNLSPTSVRAKVTGRTRAVMPVHWAGYPCDLDEINEAAGAHGLAVVEDAAHALGASYRGRPIGAISRFTAFSFQAIKHLTCGDGGALCCLGEEDARASFVRRWFGIDRASSQPSILGERLYDLTALGYKYHLNDYAAALGLANFAGLEARLLRRRAIGARYRRELAGVAGLRLLREEPDRVHAYWLFVARVQRREDFIRKLADRQIPTSVVHQRIDRYTIFGGRRDDLPGQDVFDAEQIALPVHDALTDDEVDLIVRTVQAGW